MNNYIWFESLRQKSEAIASHVKCMTNTIKNIFKKKKKTKFTLRK